MSKRIKNILIAGLIFLGLILDYFFEFKVALLVVVAIGSIMPLANGILPLLKPKITIDTFNAFALVVTLAISDFRSSAFIILMLTFAYILEDYISEKQKKAIDELMKLKPTTAFLAVGNEIKEIKAKDIKTGDILVVKEGSQIPTDGTIIFGEAQINESLITGESLPVKKSLREEVFGATTNIAGTIKIKATRVGKDSTIEKIAQLIKEASKHKSHSERIADKFAKFFLPFVLIVGLITYFTTHNILYVASLFLIACADDMAVAIPLAITASLGKAAKKGMIIKGGEWLDVLSKIKTIVIDKTGTLTYGNLNVSKVEIADGVDKKDFWEYVAVAEKLSAHPVGKAIYKEALKFINSAPDPDSFEVLKGVGIYAVYKNDKIFVGRKETEQTNSVVVNEKTIGHILVRDIPRQEAKESIAKLKNIGIQDIIMFTGDARDIAKEIGAELGIENIKSEMKPEDKLVELEKIIAKDKNHKIAMIGDGINDTPALTRADIGIAMGGAGTQVVMETADAIIFTDKLSLLPEMILLGRKTMSVIHGDMIFWFLTNVVGFALVFMGFINPAIAAFYNFATDFIPLINSSRLFKK